MFFESRQMASANDIARSDNPNSQFLIILVHWFRETLILRVDWSLCELNLTASAKCAFKP